MCAQGLCYVNSQSSRALVRTAHQHVTLCFESHDHGVGVQVLQLWGSILSCLDAFTAARELLDLTHCALDHHPRTAHNYIARAKVEDWIYQQSCHLPRRGIFMPGHDPDRRLSLEDYRLLCNNQLGVVSACSSARTGVLPESCVGARGVAFCILCFSSRLWHNC